MTRQRKLISALLVLALATGVAAGLAPLLAPLLAPPATPAPEVPTALVIATNTDYVGTCPVLAAATQGYFSRHQLAVHLQPHSSGKEALQAVLVRQADLATVADIPITFAALQAIPIQVISTIFRTGRDHGLVARRDHGIVGPADLQGKRIGVTLGTSGHFTLDVLLNRQRLDADAVQRVNLAPEALRQALADGVVDAVSGWEPFLDQTADSLGEQALRFSGAEVYESIYNIVGLAATLRQQPQAMVRLLQALQEGERYCRQQPDAAVALFPRLSASGARTLLAAWPAHHFGLELDQSLLLALEDQARWAIKHDLTPAVSVPNFLDYVYPAAMQAVSPAEVTIIY